MMREATIQRALVIVVAATVIVASSFAIARVDSPQAIALMVGAAVVLLIGYLVLYHFEAFLLVMLLVRPLLDLTALSQGPISQVTTLAGVVVIVSGGVWLGLNAVKGPSRALSPLTVALAVYSVVLILAIPGSEYPIAAITDVSRVLSGVVLFLVFDALLVRGMPVRRLLSVLVLATLVPLLLPVFGPSVGIDVFHVKDGIPALRSSFYLSNNFAHFLAPFILLGLAHLNRLEGRRRLAVLLVLAVAVAELVLAITRGAWLVVLVGLVVIGLIQNRRMLISGLVLVVLGFMFVPAVNERITDLTGDPDSPRSQSSLEWRMGHWQEIITLAEGSPMFGIGPGMTLRLSENTKTPHSDYIRAYVETGMVGLMVYLAVIGSMLWVGWEAVQRARPDKRAVAVGIFAFTCGFALASMGENLITTVSFLWYVMPLMAIANYLAHPPDSDDQVQSDSQLALDASSA